MVDADADAGIARRRANQRAASPDIQLSIESVSHKGSATGQWRAPCTELGTLVVNAVT